MSANRPDKRDAGSRAATRQRIALGALFLLGAVYLGSLIYLKTMSVDYVLAIKAKAAG